MDRDRSTDDDRPADDAPTGGTPDAGDDEREAREHIARTGEPDRDDLGNADGAS